MSGGGGETKIDRRSTEALATAIMKCITKHYRRPGDIGRSRTLEILNALAATSAVVLMGTGPDQNGIMFFHSAVNQNIEEQLKLRGLALDGPGGE